MIVFKKTISKFRQMKNKKVSSSSQYRALIARISKKVHLTKSTGVQSNKPFTSILSSPVLIQ